jgi:hypothetical protein
MIQRIQTLYLLLSAVLISLLLFLPFAEITKDGAVFSMNFKGILLDGPIIQSGIVLLLLVLVLVIMHIFVILKFKQRLVQIRIIKLLLLGLIGLLGMFFFIVYSTFSGSEAAFKIGLVFPAIAIILDWLAMRAIKKDEALIRSIDRIR